MELNQAWIERNELFAEGNKLRAEGDKLFAEGDKLRAEGDIIWINAVLENCGNTTIEYKNDKCILGTGQTFEKV